MAVSSGGPSRQVVEGRVLGMNRCGSQGRGLVSLQAHPAGLWSRGAHEDPGPSLPSDWVSTPPCSRLSLDSPKGAPHGAQG